MGASLNSGGSAGRRRGGRGRAPMAEINVTPFVDVMLVLLIIFMITAPLLVAGVPIELPETRANPIEQERDPVQISIANDGGIYVDDDLVAPQDLPTLLTQIRTETTGEDGKPPQIVLRGDKAIDYGTVLSVMGELNRAGLNNISMAGINSPAQ